MAGQVVLRRALARRMSRRSRWRRRSSAARASADNEDDDDLQSPQRLTVGVADDLLGQLGPDGKTLYFVSNRNTTNQLFAQSMADGRARQLFDDDADVTWPRVSPDGKSLLYISFREQRLGAALRPEPARTGTGAAASRTPRPPCRPSGSTTTASRSSAASRSRETCASST